MQLFYLPKQCPNWTALVLKDYGYGTPVAKQTFTPGTRTGKLYQSLIGMEHKKDGSNERLLLYWYQSLIGMEHNNILL